MNAAKKRAGKKKAAKRKAVKKKSAVLQSSAPGPGSHEPAQQPPVNVFRDHASESRRHFRLAAAEWAKISPWTT